MSIMGNEGTEPSEAEIVDALKRALRGRGHNAVEAEEIANLAWRTIKLVCSGGDDGGGAPPQRGLVIEMTPRRPRKRGFGLVRPEDRERFAASLVVEDGYEEEPPSPALQIIRDMVYRKDRTGGS